MKLAKKIPEDILIKISMGIPCEFKFKTKLFIYELGYSNGFFFHHNDPDIKGESIEYITTLLASGRFYHWHVDLGVRKETGYRSGTRYNVSFFRNN